MHTFIQPCGVEMVQSIVIGCKCDADGNVMSLKAKNLILDTNPYDKEFPDDDVTPLIANTMVQMIYTQYDMIMLLDCIGNIQKDHKAYSKQSIIQDIIVKRIHVSQIRVESSAAIRRMTQPPGKTVCPEGASLNSGCWH